MSSTLEHVPVLLGPYLELLQPRPGGRFIDCTIGGGGHSHALLERTSPDGTLLALDADPHAVEYAGRRLEPYGPRVRIVQANFRHLRDVAAREGFTDVDGVLIDLGVSSLQLGNTDRGFAFALNGPLDMRFDPSRGTSAADFVAQAPADTIERTLRQFSDEPHAHRIAGALVAARAIAPILTTGQLAALVAQAVGSHRGRLHPATRTFQALRIAVNDELAALSEALPQALELLRRGGRLAVISFHSLEDRIVKTTLAHWAGRSSGGPGRHAPAPEPPPPSPQIRILTPRPIVASVAERAANPRSRSARLRAAERL